MDEKKNLNGAGFYAALGVLLVALGLGGWAYAQTRPTKPDPLPPVTDPVHQPAVVHRPETDAPAIPAPKPAPRPAAPEPESRPTAAGADIPAPMPEKETPAVPEESLPTLIVYPVSGQVQAAFSAEELQYSETLDDWRTHDGIDLSAQLGTTVLAACAGTVADVTADDLMGTTVTLTHAGGCETVYANLQAQPPVRPGDEVSAGQIIGAVGETALAEQAQPPHLHFAVRQDGEPVDPEAFLNP